MSDNYALAGSVNFKRIKNQKAISTTAETPSANKLLEQVRKFKSIEGYLAHRLYHKYASSQNYYYLKDINAILSEERAAAFIDYKDLMVMGKKDELLKKPYKIKEYNSKLSKLAEYYKFHKEIPRIFAKDIYDTFFDHHDKKRKVEYIVITKKLKEEAGEDVKGQLEKELLKLREVRYEPLLADLNPKNKKHMVTKGYKKIKNTEEASVTIESMQDKLSRMFHNMDKSYSQLHLKTFVDDTANKFNTFMNSVAGGKLLTQTVVASQRGIPDSKVGSPGIVNIQPLSKAPTTRGNLMAGGALTSESRGAATGTVSNTKFMNSVIRASLSPDIVESLKKINLAEKKAVVGMKISKPGSLQQQPAPSVPSLHSKALTREPSTSKQSTSQTARNKSSQSIKRGLTLGSKKSYPEEDENRGLGSVRKEYTDFRITKKNSYDADVVHRKSFEKKSGLTLRSNERSEQPVSIGSWKPASSTVLKNAPSNSITKQNFFKEASDKLSRNQTLEKDKKLSSQTPHPQSGMMESSKGVGFRMDIDKLLKASGIMEHKKSRASNNSQVKVQAPSLSASKHKHTKSNPIETIQRFEKSSHQTITPAIQVSHKNLPISLTNTERELDRIGELYGKKKSLGVAGIGERSRGGYLIEGSGTSRFSGMAAAGAASGVKLVKKSNHQKKLSSKY